MANQHAAQLKAEQQATLERARQQAATGARRSGRPNAGGAKAGGAPDPIRPRNNARSSSGYNSNTTAQPSSHKA